MPYDFDNARLATRPRPQLAEECIRALTGLDVLAREMERKWGHCRLPHLVPDDLSRRFYSQHRKVSQALLEGRDEDAIQEIAKMVNAWRYLDQVAESSGAEPIRPMVLETSLSDGTVIAIIRDEDDAAAVEPSDREVRVFTVSEIARLLELHPTVCAVKAEFPGATVMETRLPTPQPYPLLDDEIPF